MPIHRACQEKDCQSHGLFLCSEETGMHPLLYYYIILRYACSIHAFEKNMNNYIVKSSMDTFENLQLIVNFYIYTL